MTKVVCRAPCRVDYAGGTLDLWPLYLYFGGLELVHMALELRAQVEISYKKTSGKKHSISIESAEMRSSQKYKSLQELHQSLEVSTTQNPLRWINRMVAHYLGEQSSWGEWNIRCQSAVPPGSGLGGSSVLGMSLAWALKKSLKQKATTASSAWGVQQTVRDLEAIEIAHPAGDQDYVPAIFGGLLNFKLGVQTRSVEKFSRALAEGLAARSALIYTGKPHHSGLNNWQVFKGFHEGDRVVRSALGGIHDCSKRMAQELRDGKLDGIADLINEEWALRQRLSPAVQAPVLEEAWDFARLKGKAVARKACGAGGGGCLLVVFKSAADRDAAAKLKLPQSNWIFYPVQVAHEGLLRG